MPEEAPKTGRTFTEAEHFAILTDAVAREVAKACEERDTAIAELQSKVDVLEAEKAAEAQKRETVEAEFAAYKTQVETAQQVEARKAERMKAVREIAGASLPDSYFAEERVTRWAEMAEEAFEGFLDDLADTRAATLAPEKAQALNGLEGQARRQKLIELLADVKDGKEKAGAAAPGKTHVVTETAAFTGGQSGGAGGEASTALSLLQARRGRVPAKTA